MITTPQSLPEITTNSPPSHPHLATTAGCRVRRIVQMKTELHLASGFTKCIGLGCDRRDTCRRYTDPQSKEQDWASFYALPDCDFYVGEAA